MAERVLTDTAKGTHLAELKPWPLGDRGRVQMKTLLGGPSHGLRLLEIDNGAFQFSVLPERGMNVWKASLGELDLGWKAPIQGPVHPSLVPVGEPDGLGWLFGFDEFLVRCGLESNGAPGFDEKGLLQYPLHGRIANLPAHFLSVTYDEQTQEIAVRGIVDEARLHFSKLRLVATFRTKLGEPGFRVHDEIVNLGGAPQTAQMLYHTNFGPPLCFTGSRVSLPVKQLVPRNDHAARDIGHWDTFGPPRPGFAEQVYFFTTHADAQNDAFALLRNPAGTAGASLQWDIGELPCFSLWKNTPPLVDGYVTGLEPGTNYPNPRAHETKEKRVQELAPGASAKFELKLVVHPTAASVAEMEARIAKSQQTAPPEIAKQPLPGWVAM